MSSESPRFDSKVCLYELSKNLNGKLALIKSGLQKCGTPSCTTFKTIHSLNVEVKTSGTLCDSVNGMKLDGKLSIKELVHGLTKDGNSRGYHTGKFTWLNSTGALATGQIWGITNAGTHRLPLNECETCNKKGHMEGRLLGKITSGPLSACAIYGSYSFVFENTSTFQSITIKGTIEGIIECPCT